MLSASRTYTRPSTSHLWHVDDNILYTFDKIDEYLAYDETVKNIKFDRNRNFSDDGLSLTITSIWFEDAYFDEYHATSVVQEFFNWVSSYYDAIGGSISERHIIKI